MTYAEAVWKFRRRLIERTVKRLGKEQAAKQLQINRAHLYKLCKRFNIQGPRVYGHHRGNWNDEVVR